MNCIFSVWLGVACAAIRCFGLGHQVFSGLCKNILLFNIIIVHHFLVSPHIQCVTCNFILNFYLSGFVCLFLGFFVCLEWIREESKKVQRASAVREILQHKHEAGKIQSMVCYIQ